MTFATKKRNNEQKHNYERFPFGVSTNNNKQSTSARKQTKF